MSKEYERLKNCLECVRRKTNFEPMVAIVLGSGLGDFAENIKIEATIDYHEIDGFPTSTVSGHKGRFVFGYVGNVPVVIMQGRVHYYEGYSMRDVVLPTRLMRMMGAKILFLTNAAGSINKEYMAGDFMMITNQILNFVPSPLIGENVDELGPRFPDMSEIYNKQLQNIIRNTAKTLKINLHEGVYVQLTGPNYETSSEVDMCRILGGDVLGMSTGCEAVAGNHCGMKVCGISCISNTCYRLTGTPLSHKEVFETANKVAPIFRKLIFESVLKIGELL